MAKDAKQSAGQGKSDGSGQHRSASKLHWDVASADKLVFAIAVILLFSVVFAYFHGNYGLGTAFLAGEEDAASSQDSPNSGVTITDCSFNGTWHQDNTVSVTQVITFDFSTPHDSLRLRIPTVYYVPGSASGSTSGSSIECTAEVRDATVTGGRYHAGGTDSAYVTIGGDGQQLAGSQTCSIQYTYDLPYVTSLDGSGDYLLYYQLLEPTWKLPVDHFSFRMDFDEPLPESSQRSLHVFSGNADSEEDALGIDMQVSATSVQGQASGLDIAQGIVLIGTVPTEYFPLTYVRPSASDLPAPVLSCLFISVSLALYMLARAILSQRSAANTTVVCRPPQHMSPAQAAVILRGSAEQEDALSLIPWWANRGYVTIRRDQDDYGNPRLVITKARDLPTNRPKHESAFFAAVFKDGSSFSLPIRERLSADSFDKTLTQAQRGLDEHFRDERRLQQNAGMAWALGLLAIIAFGLALYLSTEPMYFGSSMGNSFSAVAAFVLMLIIMRYSRRGYAHGKVASRVVAAVLCGIPAFQLVRDVSQGVGTAAWPSWLVILGFVACLLSCICFPYLMVNTPYRKERLPELLGLREFIRTAEPPQLQDQLQKDKLYYYKILPYAMAFQLEEDWRKRWEDLDTGTPDWYSLVPPHGSDAAEKAQQTGRNVSAGKGLGVALRQGAFMTIESTTRRNTD